jgi:hypothetical protein
VKNRVKAIMFGLLFMLINLVMVYIFGQITDLTCTKSEGNVTQCIAERSLLGVISISTREFVDVNDARIESNCDDEGCTYRVILTTTNGQQPLTNAYTSGESGKARLVNDINDYIDSPDRTEVLNMRDSGSLWAALMSFGLSLFGLYLIIVRGLFAPVGD